MSSAELSRIMPARGQGAADLAILNSVTRQRQLSNYFFIAIAIIMVGVDFALSIYCITYPAGSAARYLGVAMSAAFGIAALPLALYWRQELHEFYVLHKIMYQALMDEERIYSDSGTLSKFWDRVGDVPDRTSAVFSVRGAKVMPALLASLQIVPLYMNLFFLLSPLSIDGASQPPSRVHVPVNDVSRAAPKESRQP